MPDSRKQPDTLRCNNCGAENPRKAYCCLHCYKVLRPKEDIPWYRVQIKPSFPVGVGLVLVSLLGIVMIKRWMEDIEAQITMNFKSAEYNVQVRANKRKKQSLFEVKHHVDSTDADTDGGAAADEPSQPSQPSEN